MTATLASLRSHDTADMLGAVETIASQLTDGLQRARTVRDAIAETFAGGAGAVPRTLVLCGMGGSGVGADLLPAAADVACPIIAVKGYDLPSWVSDEDRVVCVSYSGETAETLSTFEQAMSRSVVSAVIATGGSLGARARDEDVPFVELPSGMQPRAAVGAGFGALVGVAEALGVVDHADRLIGECVDGVDIAVAQNSGDGAEHGGDVPPSLAFAEQLAGKVIVISGAKEMESVAWRWKAQINENGKVPAFANAQPELCHNELCGWEYARDVAPSWALVELLPFAPSEGISARFDTVRSIISDAVDIDLRFQPQSATRAGAVFENLVWGDYISIHLALLRGIDPTPVDRIHRLKGELNGR